MVMDVVPTFVIGVFLDGGGAGHCFRPDQASSENFRAQATFGSWKPQKLKTRRG